MWRCPLCITLPKKPPLPGILRQAFGGWARRWKINKAYIKLLIVLHGHGDTPPRCHLCQRETLNQKNSLKTGTAVSWQMRQKMAMLKPRRVGSFEKTVAPGRAHCQPPSSLNWRALPWRMWWLRGQALETKKSKAHWRAEEYLIFET